MATDTTTWVIFLALAILGTFAILFFFLWIGWRHSTRQHGASPYTGTPLRRASDLSYYSLEQALRFMYDFQQYDNRIFKISRASFCRETGRIFFDSISWFDVIHVDWTFLQKRHPGTYVSWGSLTSAQQEYIRKAHDSLEGFQTEQSSPTPSPRLIEPEYAYIKPGPLYVDFDRKTLLGWKIIPGTELEVLIVQKPIR